jgi:hypothetical protein
MWVRGAAIRPVPSFATVDRATLERVARHVKESPERFGETVRTFETEQPHLAAAIRRVLERPLDETVRSVGSLVVVTLWAAFREMFASRLRTLTREDMQATEESLKVEEELRREHAEEPLDLEDVVHLEQPAVVEWIHEHVDAVTDLSRIEDDGEIDVDDLHLVYRTALTITLALSYAVEAPAGEGRREIMA